MVFKESSGTFILDDDASDDLRGLSPNTAPGAASSTDVEFPDSVFRIQDDGDVTKQIAFQASSITTGNTRQLQCLMKILY